MDTAFLEGGIFGSRPAGELRVQIMSALTFDAFDELLRGVVLQTVVLKGVNICTFLGRLQILPILTLNASIDSLVNFTSIDNLLRIGLALFKYIEEVLIVADGALVVIERNLAILHLDGATLLEESLVLIQVEITDQFGQNHTLLLHSQELVNAVNVERLINDVAIVAFFANEKSVRGAVIYCDIGFAGELVKAQSEPRFALNALGLVLGILNGAIGHWIGQGDTLTRLEDVG